MQPLITWHGFNRKPGTWWLTEKFTFLISRGCFLTVLGLLFSTNSWSQQLERLAHFPQWPGVSQVVVYNERIWFVNSDPYKDNNNADIYSVAYGESIPRYERSLFSQDAGEPVVHEGLLYWPFEDPRRSAGTGEYAVTDGVNWQWESMQSGSVMHVHAMNVCDGKLVAVTGAWTGQFHEQGDDQRWQVEYDYPAGDASFSRLVGVSEFGDQCIVAASARGEDEAKLFAISGAERKALPGWPNSDRVDSIVSHKGSLYAFVDSGSARQLLRYDGSGTHTVAVPAEHRPRALHSDGENLWLGTQTSKNNKLQGQLWKFDDEAEFMAVQVLEEVPIALAGYKGAVAIGTYASSGGALWLYDKPQDSIVTAINPVSLTSTTSATEETEPNAPRVQELYDELFELVMDPASTKDFARVLRQQLSSHSALKTPEFGAAVTKLLTLSFEGEPTTMFTDEVISREDLIRWYLVTTLAINGRGRVSPSWFNPDEPLSAPSSGKLFHPSIAAIVAAGWLGQDDKSTLDALFKRLGNASDPFWVKADVIGALTALTDKRFGYDTDSWNAWWEAQP